MDGCFRVERLEGWGRGAGGVFTGGGGGGGRVQQEENPARGGGGKGADILQSPMPTGNAC